jgi:hypothetical protein
MVGKPVEPGEAEVPQIGQNEAARSQRSYQIAGGDLLVLMGVGDELHGMPQLAPDVEQTGQLVLYRELLKSRQPSCRF